MEKWFLLKHILYCPGCGIQVTPENVAMDDEFRIICDDQCRPLCTPCNSKRGQPVLEFASTGPCQVCGFPMDENKECHMCNADESETEFPLDTEFNANATNCIFQRIGVNVEYGIVNCTNALNESGICYREKCPKPNGIFNAHESEGDKK